MPFMIELARLVADDALEEMANASAGIKPAAKAQSDADVVVDPEDDFEEFAPVDISNLGN